MIMKTSILLGLLIGFISFIGLMETYSEHQESSLFWDWTTGRIFNGWILYPVVSWFHVLLSGLFIFYLFSTPLTFGIDGFIEIGIGFLFFQVLGLVWFVFTHKEGSILTLIILMICSIIGCIISPIIFILWFLWFMIKEFFPNI